MSVSDRVEEIIKLSIGDLVMTCARLRADNEQLRAELEAVTQIPKPEPPPHDAR